MLKKISYTNPEELIGSVWRFIYSDNCEVELVGVHKSTSRTGGKLMTFRHLTYDKPNFITNEENFKRSFNWAERIR